MKRKYEDQTLEAKTVADVLKINIEEKELLK